MKTLRSLESTAAWATLVLGLASSLPAAAQGPTIVCVASQPARPGVRAASTAPDGTTFGPLHAYAPAELYAAYHVDQLHAEGITGEGQTIVLVALDSPTAHEDLHQFSLSFGLPEADLTIIYPDGRPTYRNAMYGGAFEASLDLQWAHAMAPDAKLVLIAGNPPETEGVQGLPSIFKGLEYAVAHYPGSIISQSFGVYEPTFHSAADEQVAKFDKVYQAAADARCTVLASAGDTGSAGAQKKPAADPNLRVYPFPVVGWPASDPLVTAVGGTWLQAGWRWDPLISVWEFYQRLSQGEDYGTLLDLVLNSSVAGGPTEAVWREDWLVPAATGGGLSALFPTPTFQQGLPPSLLQGRRGIPDLACNAAVDGGVLVFMGFTGTPGWYVVGGTSAASPEVAGMIALANQLRNQNGKPPVGYLNPILYTLPARDFNDIVPETFGAGAAQTTLDDNAIVIITVPGFITTPGWDLTTGFGSPNAYWLAHDLAEIVP